MFFLNNGYYKKLCSSKTAPVSTYAAFKKRSFKFLLNNFYLSFRWTEVHVECLYKYTFTNKENANIFVTKKLCYICLEILTNYKISSLHFLFFFIHRNNNENYFSFLFKYRQNIYNILKLFFLKRRKKAYIF